MLCEEQPLLLTETLFSVYWIYRKTKQAKIKWNYKFKNDDEQIIRILKY